MRGSKDVTAKLEVIFPGVGLDQRHRFLSKPLALRDALCNVQGADPEVHHANVRQAAAISTMDEQLKRKIQALPWSFNSYGLVT